MGKLRRALRVVTDMGLIVIGLGIFLTGYAVAAGVVSAVGVYLVWADVHGEEEPI
jgi:hypothetical protein